MDWSIHTGNVMKRQARGVKRIEIHSKEQRMGDYSEY